MPTQQCTRWTCDACLLSVVTDDRYNDGGGLDEPGWEAVLPEGWFLYDHQGQRILCSDCWEKLDALLASFFRFSSRTEGA